MDQTKKKLGHCEIDSMVERNQMDFFLPYYPDFFHRILLIRVRPSYLKLRRPKIEILFHFFIQPL